ncbi:MAG: hypothetical protein K2X35_06740 [Bryobacteraceae bacterium]|nr:hypothetical protein [Bryobacteraceae bacterium]
MRIAAFGLCITAVLAAAETPSQRLAAKLGEEAAKFAEKAPRLIARETLRHRSLKRPPRFRPRMGESARRPLEATWQQRQVVSEYGFASFQDGGFHEIRQVVEVDGKKVAGGGRAVDSLADMLTAKNEDRLRKQLRELEKHGLRGAASDFGQVILLFSKSRLVQFEIMPARITAGEAVFDFRQIDGSPGMTLFDAAKADRPVGLELKGQILVRPSDYRPFRITLSGAPAIGKEQVRQEAVIEYEQSPHGLLVPSRVLHREYRDGKVTLENDFRYQEFKLFAASSEIKFE